MKLSREKKSQCTQQRTAEPEMETNLKRRGYRCLFTWKLCGQQRADTERAGRLQRVHVTVHRAPGVPSGSGLVRPWEPSQSPGDQPRGHLFVPGRGLLSKVSNPRFHRGKPQDSGGVAEPGGQAPNVPDPHSDRGPCRPPGGWQAARSLWSRSRCHRCTVLGTGEERAQASAFQLSEESTGRHRARLGDSVSFLPRAMSEEVGLPFRPRVKT